MGSYRAVGAGDCNPMWTANWFDPLGRDRPTRAEESALAGNCSRCGGPRA